MTVFECCLIKLLPYILSEKYINILALSVLWRCWLGGRKRIRLVENWVVGCWRGYLSGARCRLAYGPADATATHCHSTPSVKSIPVLPFWYRLTRVVAEKGPLNGCVCLATGKRPARGNRHCANCIGALSSTVHAPARRCLARGRLRDSETWRTRDIACAPRNSTLQNNIRLIIIIIIIFVHLEVVKRDSYKTQA